MKHFPQKESNETYKGSTTKRNPKVPEYVVLPRFITLGPALVLEREKYKPIKNNRWDLIFVVFFLTNRTKSAKKKNVYILKTLIKPILKRVRITVTFFQRYKLFVLFFKITML